MAIEDIIRQIDEDAKAEADSLLANAEAEAGAIREKARRQAKKLHTQEMQQAEEKAGEHARRLETLAGLELRKNILRVKKSLIEDAFSRAASEIADMSPGEYRAFLKPIILGAVESCNEEIVPSQRHREVFSSAFLESLNAKLNTETASLRLSEDSGNFSGGFILRDGRKETNMTLSSLIASRRDELESKIAKTLFGEKP